jgi:hypothetical protein
MSRIATGNEVTVRPTNNIYTVLVAVALLAEIIGFIALFLRYTEIFNGSLFG